jgi:hypothetical protein
MSKQHNLPVPDSASFMLFLSVIIGFAGRARECVIERSPIHFL